MPIIHTHDDLGHEIRQGSASWMALRCGRPTASRFSSIITPAKMEYSKAAHGYAAQLIGEQILGHPLDIDDEVANAWTERGTEMEDEARKWLELERGYDIRQVAFVTSDDGSEGGSPDGLVSEDGIVELKVRGAKAHMGCLLGLEDVASVTQVQGLLRVTGRKWIDVCGYSPKLPPVLYRVTPDPVFQKALGECLAQFKADMAKAKERLEAIGSARIDDNLLATLAASVRKKKTTKAADIESTVEAMYGPPKLVTPEVP